MLNINELFKKQNLPYLILGVILLLHSLILNKLIFFPYPELFIYPYLTNQGLKPYQQILDQHFPGLMFLPINFNNLGMTTPEIARIWLIAVVLLTHLLLFFISKDFFKSDKKALFVNLLYLVWQPFFEGWVLWIDSFLPLLLLPAFYFLYKRRPFATGLFLGGAIVFKQVVIPLSFLIFIYILWERRKIKDVAVYFIGLFIPIIAMLGYLFSIGVLKDFWYWTVTFNLTIFANYGRKFAPTVGHILRVALVFGAGGLVLRFWNERTVQILVIFLLGALATAISRFDFVHFQPALPFALLATVYGLGRLRGLGKLGVTTFYGLILVWWLVIFYKGHLGDKIFFFDKQIYELVSKIKQYTKEGDKIFVYGAVPHLYQMSNTLPAGDIFVFQFSWFLQVSEDRILRGLRKDIPEVIVANRNAEIEGQEIKDYAKKLDQYILQNYQPIDRVGSYVILRRNPT